MIDKETLKRCKRSFKTYVNVPVILGIVILVLFLLVGIVFGLVGIIDAVSFLVLFIAGLVMAALVAVVADAIISARVLQVYYLSKIYNKIGDDKNEKNTGEWESEKLYREIVNKEIVEYKVNIQTFANGSCRIEKTTFTGGVIDCKSGVFTVEGNNLSITIDETKEKFVYTFEGDDLIGESGKFEKID